MTRPQMQQRLRTSRRFSVAEKVRKGAAVARWKQPSLPAPGPSPEQARPLALRQHRQELAPKSWGLRWKERPAGNPRRRAAISDREAARRFCAFWKLFRNGPKKIKVSLIILVCSSHSKPLAELLRNSYVHAMMLGDCPRGTLYYSTVLKHVCINSVHVRVNRTAAVPDAPGAVGAVGAVATGYIHVPRHTRVKAWAPDSGPAGWWRRPGRPSVESVRRRQTPLTH